MIYKSHKSAKFAQVSFITNGVVSHEDKLNHKSIVYIFFTTAYEHQLHTVQRWSLCRQR